MSPNILLRLRGQMKDEDFVSRAHIDATSFRGVYVHFLSRHLSYLLCLTLLPSLQPFLPESTGITFLFHEADIHP